MLFTELVNKIQLFSLPKMLAHPFIYAMNVTTTSKCWNRFYSFSDFYMYVYACRHPTSCASMAEIMSVLFFHTMKYKISAPRDASSDRFILSKGHAAPILYAGQSFILFIHDCKTYHCWAIYLMKVGYYTCLT